VNNSMARPPRTCGIMSSAGCAPLPLPGGSVQCWPAGGIRGRTAGVNNGR